MKNMKWNMSRVKFGVLHVGERKKMGVMMCLHVGKRGKWRVNVGKGEKKNALETINVYSKFHA